MIESIYWNHTPLCLHSLFNRYHNSTIIKCVRPTVNLAQFARISRTLLTLQHFNISHCHRVALVTWIRGTCIHRPCCQTREHVSVFGVGQTTPDAPECFGNNHKLPIILARIARARGQIRECSCDVIIMNMYAGITETILC